MFFRITKRFREKVFDDCIGVGCLIDVPHDVAGQKITQPAWPPAVAGFCVVESSPLLMKLWQRRLNGREIAAFGTARQVPIPSDHAEVVVDSGGCALSLPAFNDLIERITSA